jgi:putative NADH-flavin reductase
MLVSGKRTGRYRLGDDELVMDKKGVSSISMEDFAVAVLDEAERAKHTKRRFTVSH